MSKSEQEDNIFTVVGGTYYELCEEPYDYSLYGSGLRGAACLANKGFEIILHSYIGKEDKSLARYICDAFGVNERYTESVETTTFEYYHPLSKPIAYPAPDTNAKNAKTVDANNILYYGLYETEIIVHGEYVVYDPQNHISFKTTGSTAKHLAIILNKNEALLLSGMDESIDLREVGNQILAIENADVVVIKNSAKGAIVFDESGVHEIPVFKVPYIYPIGSGDIFTAIFAWQWIMKKEKPVVAATIASGYTAHYCNTKILPLPTEPVNLEPLPIQHSQKKIYLAGSFFTIASRWLINELYRILFEFGNDVFSPLHDVGYGCPTEIADKDLKGLEGADVILAVVSDLDAGTLFEIGYGKALDKRIVVLSENVSDGDLLMLIGSGCEITNDLSTAIYWASW